MTPSWLAAGRWEASSTETGDDLAAWAAATLAGADVAAGGLYVATGSAGARESLSFWRAGRQAGLAFANPRLFPWTLANSPTGAIARALDVRGPTYTLLGAADAVEAIVEHAWDDLTDDLVDTALVVGVDAVGERVEMTAALLGQRESPSEPRLLGASPEGGPAPLAEAPRLLWSLVQERWSRLPGGW